MVFTLWKCLLSVLVWNIYSHHIVRNKSDIIEYKLAQNIVSATHAYLCIPIISLIYYNILSDQWGIYWSMGFYITDTIYLLLNKWNSITIGYLYHHSLAIIALNLMFLDKYKQDITELLFLAELSNLPLYIVYYLKKKRPNSRLYKICLNIEICQYGFIRIFGFGSYLYVIYQKYDTIIITNCYILYGMGLYWSIQLCKSAPFLKN
jgi:hypothetical protein